MLPIRRCHVQLEISSLQSAREESEALSSHVKSLTYELDTERALWATSKETLVQEKETAETNLSSALGEKASSQAECSELRTLLTDLQERHDKLGQTSAEQLDSLKEELRRYVFLFAALLLPFCTTGMC